MDKDFLIMILLGCLCGVLLALICNCGDPDKAPIPVPPFDPPKEISYEFL